jgi:hypothetical protein
MCLKYINYKCVKEMYASKCASKDVPVGNPAKDMPFKYSMQRCVCDFQITHLRMYLKEMQLKTCLQGMYLKMCL